MATGGVMSSNLIIVVTLLYLYIAIDQILKNNIWMGVVYGAYAVANIGLIFSVK